MFQFRIHSARKKCQSFVLAFFLAASCGAQDTLWSMKMAKTAMSLWPAGKPTNWNYEQGFVMRSVETVWQKNPFPLYFNYIQAKTDYFVNNTGNISTYNIGDYNIDHVASGRALLFLYKQTNTVKYKLAADKLRSQLATHPRTSEGGFWHKKIYPDQMWLDGLFMGEPFYAEYSLLFNQSHDFDDVCKQFLLMEKRARDTTTGLLYHGWDESKQQPWANPVTGKSPCVWGRAMGWYAMALVDVLDYLPPTHSKRDSIVQILQRLSVSIDKYQDNSSGLWYQVMDKADQAGNYTEASASCMFVYAIAKATRLGYIQQSYRQVAQKGYEAILHTFIETDNVGNVHLNGICPAVGLGGTPYRDGSYAYYVSVKGIKDDPKGVAAFILASVEMEKDNMTLGFDQQDLPSPYVLYPNPVTDQLFIQDLQDPSAKITLYNTEGQLVYSGHDDRLDMRSFLAGIYFLEVSSSHGSRKHKVLKKP